MELLLDGGLHEDGADIPGRAAQDRRHQAVVCPLPQKHLEQALRAHADGPLHTDLRHPGVDVGVDRVDDVEKADEGHEQDQSPGQHPDLGEGLLQLPVRVLVGQTDRPRNPLRQGRRRPVKGLPVRALRQGGQQLPVDGLSGEPGIQILIHDDLYAVDKAAVADAQEAVVAVHGMQHVQDLPGCGHSLACGNDGAGKLLPLVHDGHGIADHAALSRLQTRQSVLGQVRKDRIPVGAVEPHHLEGLRRLEGEPDGDARQRAVRPLLIAGKLHGEQLRHLGIVPHGRVFLRGEAGSFIGDGVVPQVVRRPAPGRVQQSHRTLEGDKDGDAHDQGQHRDGRAARAAPQVQPGVEGLEAADPPGAPASAPDRRGPAGHGGRGRHPGGVPGGGEGGQKGEEEGDGGAHQQVEPLSAAVLLDQAIQLPAVLDQKDRGGEEAGGGGEDAPGGQGSQQQPQGNARRAQQQRLSRDQKVHLTPAAAHGPQHAVLGHAPGHGDFQDVVDHQPRRQQDQGPYQQSRRQQEGEAAAVGNVGGLPAVGDPKGLQIGNVVCGVQLVDLQLGYQLVHDGLEGPRVRHAQIHVIVEVRLRQQGLRRPRSHDAVDNPGAVVKVVALGDAHQGEVGGEVVGLDHYPVAQGLGQGEGQGLPQLPSGPQIAQHILWQSDFHGRLRQTALLEGGEGGVNRAHVLLEVAETQDQGVVQLHAPHHHMGPHKGQPGVLPQRLHLGRIHLNKAGVEVPADGHGLLQAHGGEHPGGLADHGRHHGGEDHRQQDQRGGDRLGQQLLFCQTAIAPHHPATSERIPSTMDSRRGARAAMRLSWVIITRALPSS